MQELDDGQRAFSSFRALNGEGSGAEQDQLFRSMAQLFAYVSGRADDDQVAQYDEVLCQLADLVEVEARVHVAKLLAPLERAPGSVVVRLANDQFEVAQPLLEFSNVLNDDDLIDIITNRSEAHRIAIAGRPNVAERVGDAIVEFGGQPSVTRLIKNTGAVLGQKTIERLVGKSESDEALAAELRNRPEIDWKAMQSEVSTVAGRVLESLGQVDRRVDTTTATKVNAVVYNRLRNRAGFSAQEWKVAYNQVKALSDRKQLDQRALARFARFGYGHHAAAALTMILRINPEVFVKWLAMQDYVAVTVALRASGISADLFEATVGTLPWRDLPSEQDKMAMQARFEALTQDETSDIFQLWRAHSFRRRPAGEEAAAGAA